MPKDPTYSSAIFASDLLDNGQNAATLNGLTSEQFMRSDASAAPLNDDSVVLGNATHRYKSIWTLSLNDVSFDLFSRRNRSHIPTLDNTFTMGDGTHRWKQVFGVEIRGNKVTTDQIYSTDSKAYSHTKLGDIGKLSHEQLDSHVESTTLVHGATDGNVPGRIVARDNSGGFSASTIKAKLGDLAEYYTTDTIGPVGTVYCVSSYPECEVEICNEPLSTKVVGVRSSKPGLILSTATDGVLLGLKGKVPIRVVGPVKKGDMLGSAGNGCAFVTTNPSSKIAVSLEENMSMEEKLVMAVL